MVEKKIGRMKKVVKKSKKKKSIGKKIVEEIKSQCYYCGNPIFNSDKQIILITRKDGKNVEEVGFHFDCWVEYFNKAVTKKAKQNVAIVQKKVTSLVENPMIKSLLSNVKGTDNLFSMLQMPLTEGDVDEIKEKIRVKIDDDRKRTGNSSSKRKKT